MKKINLTKCQKEIFDTNKKNIIVSTGRRGGKTLISINHAYKYCLNHDNATVVCLAPTQEMAWEQMLECVFEEDDIKKKIDDDMLLIFKNGSHLYFDNVKEFSWPATIDLLILDDCAFAEKKYFNFFYSYLDNPNVEVLFISTPDKNNNYFKLYQKALKDPENNYTYTYSALDSGLINNNSIEYVNNTLKKTLSKKAYKREVLGQFTPGFFLKLKYLFK